MHYDPSTGLFTRLKVYRRPDLVGTVAGHVREDGYRVISIDGRRYLAHRLAWLYVHGKWPDEEMDHRNGAPGVDRIDNLRPANSSENCQNRGRRSDNTTGFIGVSLHKRSGKFQARIGVGKRRRHLGLFDAPEQAYAKYVEAKAALHKFQPEVRA